MTTDPTELDPAGMSMTGPATSPLRAFLRINEVHVTGLLVAIASYAGLLATRFRYQHRRVVFTVLAMVLWCALLASGIDPVVAGLAVGPATSAYVPRRDALERFRARHRADVGYGNLIPNPGCSERATYPSARV